MMNKQIRSMVDEIFSDMKMTAENLALRDELMANAQARYEDMIAQGRSEDEAFMEVAASLDDVCGLLDDMKRMDAQPQAEPEAETPVPELKLGTEDEQAQDGAAAEGGEAAQAGADAPQTDLGDALNKAFTALGDFGQAIMPEAKKIYNQVDDATGGVLGKLRRAAKQGMRDAQKAAEKTLDRMGGEGGELVFDFGANKEASPQEKNEPQAEPGETPEDMQDDLEAAMEQARREAERAACEAEEPAAEADPDACDAQQADGETAGNNAAEDRKAGDQVAEDQADGDEAAEDTETGDAKDGAGEGEDRETFDEDAFARSVDEMTREAEAVLHQAAQAARDAVDYVVRDDSEPVSGAQTFPAAGLHRVDIQLDADDVDIVPTEGSEVEVLWEAKNADSEPVVTLSDHTLSIRRKNPDVFKTFFSVFQQAGGRITVRVPRGYAASLAITTTCGDVHIGDLDVDDVKVNTTSGSVRVEPNAKIRAGGISVTTVSGHAAVSACADTIAVTTVSGGQFISCDANKVDVNVVSGKVHVEGACDEWEVSAVSSDVELMCTAAPTRKVQISSVHGDVRLALPSDIRGFVAQSSGALGCEIINEFGPNRYGTCGLPIRMETMRGKLIITRL